MEDIEENKFKKLRISAKRSDLLCSRSPTNIQYKVHQHADEQEDEPLRALDPGDEDEAAVDCHRPRDVCCETWQNASGHRRTHEGAHDLPPV